MVDGDWWGGAGCEELFFFFSLPRDPRGFFLGLNELCNVVIEMWDVLANQDQTGQPLLETVGLIKW